MMKKRSDGLYKKSLVIGYNNNGTPKRKYVYGHSQLEVNNKLADLKSLHNKGLYSETGSITLEDWSKKWFDLYKSNKAYNTQKEYTNAIYNYIIPELGNYKLKNIKQCNVQELINSIVEMGKLRTAEQILITIKQILEKAIEQDYIYKNVAKGVNLQIKYKAKEKITLTTEELKIFEEISKTHRAGVFFMVMCYTGMRREEIVPLSIHDIDFKNKNIIINKAVYFKCGHPILKDTKNGEHRIIPILDVIYPMLKELQLTNKTDYIFTKQDGNILSETALKRMLESFIKKCNEHIDKLNKGKKENEQIKHMNFTFHTLRHTFCTILYYSGVGLKETQDIMGHKDSKMVLDVYTHLDKSEIKTTTDKLNNYISSKIYN